MSVFENEVREDLRTYLLGRGEIDERMPEAPDIENLWEKAATSYLSDGIREFGGYPTVSLGWMMYVGMAVAQYWDTDWEVYGQLPDVYAYLRDKRGYDAMDEYVRQDVLRLEGEEYMALERLVGECASRTHSRLQHGGFEPGTPEAFRGYVACLHQLYLMGAAVQLRRMGYHMTAV